jgi:hypothetical protein
MHDAGNVYGALIAPKPPIPFEPQGVRLLDRRHYHERQRADEVRGTWGDKAEERHGWLPKHR